jgi:UDP-N-acetylglucosamine/UDP-N-acetylgalactosamine diphosphorylase
MSAPPAVPEHLHQALRRHGQEHTLAAWHSLDAAARQALLEQLRTLDLELLARLYADRDRIYRVPEADRIAPVPVIPRQTPKDAERRRLGEEALRRGEVAVLVVAGGQGSRLSFEHPKGMFEVGPVSRKSLFQIHAEKVLALRRRYGAAVPFLVMTSPATHDETLSYFAERRYFSRRSPLAIHFFCQGTMPALDLATGRLLMEHPGCLFLSPDGHGGTLTALAKCGLLRRLQDEGIRHIFYFQVDNPVVSMADPLFLGHHLAHQAEVSSKVIPKNGPTDRLGNFVLVDGRCTIIEYSDLPEELARQTGPDGRLRLWAGSPAIHWFDTAFLDRVTSEATSLPLHIARKKVPHVGPDGRAVRPQTENALKFERFIFDVLPLARQWTVVETSRREEFAPLKNATGADSPAEVERALSNQAADWLQAAGVAVPRDAEGNAAVPLEVSPLFALDTEEFAAQADRGWRIDGPRYFDGT